IINNYKIKTNQFFLTGDLGFMALEEVQKTFSNRFINAGIAEQNMVNVAAALAKDGFIPWIYSITPFVVLRPFEQIRNNIGLHNLPVKIAGNGGGFGYGIMGATHHCIEDIGVMKMIPNMEVFIPFTASDVHEIVYEMIHNMHPNYLRLNKVANIPYPIEKFKTWRKIKSGNKAVIIGTGTVLANIFNFPDLIEDVEVWLVSKFPIVHLPEELIKSITISKKILTIEEHIATGGLGENIAKICMEDLSFKTHFKALHIQGYLSGKYGSQQWHLEENGLSGNTLKNNLESFLC
ncbi:MAG: hypothetical protein ORN58_02835, partial [Sediminibacterium sp.]|nr:hypothetical protein [Sediminibacterium sp.]